MYIICRVVLPLIMDLFQLAALLGKNSTAPAPVPPPPASHDMQRELSRTQNALLQCKEDGKRKAAQLRVCDAAPPNVSVKVGGKKGASSTQGSPHVSQSLFDKISNGFSSGLSSLRGKVGCEIVPHAGEKAGDSGKILGGFHEPSTHSHSAKNPPCLLSFHDRLCGWGCH